MIRKRLAYNELLEKSAKVFIEVVAQETISSQSYGAIKSIGHPQNPRKNAGLGSGKDVKRRDPSASSSKMPVCPYPLHKAEDLRHLLKDCHDCPRKQKDKLFETLCGPKNDKIQRIFAVLAKDKHSTVFLRPSLQARFAPSFVPTQALPSPSWIDVCWQRLRKPVQSFKWKGRTLHVVSTRQPAAAMELRL